VNENLQAKWDASLFRFIRAAQTDKPARRTRRPQAGA